MTDTADLVRRLRDPWGELQPLDGEGGLMRSAADCIERLSAPAEPVAWMYVSGNGRMYADELDDSTVWTPLYAHPAAPAPAKSLAEWKQQAQDFLDAPAPDAATKEKS